MTRLSENKAKGEFSDVLDRVAYSGERIVLHRRGKNVAVIIPFKELKIMERMIKEAEDRSDLEAIRKAQKEPGEDIPYKKVRRDVYLKR